MLGFVGWEQLARCLGRCQSFASLSNVAVNSGSTSDTWSNPPDIVSSILSSFTLVTMSGIDILEKSSGW